MESKACFKCGKDKPLGEFYPHPQMADGHLNKCKVCTKADAKANRDANIDYYREYDKERANNPNRVSARAEYIKTQAGKQSHEASAARWKERNQVRRAAQIIVGNAVRDGRLVKPGCCETCAKKKSLQGHHDDYTKPLDVRWLCAKCHKEWHAVNEPIDG